MAVCRIEKTKDYTVMANHHLRNKTLSLKAKGLLSLMLSLPDDWDYSVKGLTYICKDGIDSINGAIKELEATGYISRKRIRNAKGQLTDIEYVIREYPKIETESEPPNSGEPKEDKPTSDIPTLENPILDTPTQENHVQLNTYLLTNNKSKKDLLSINISNPYQSNPYEQTTKTKYGYDEMGFDSLEELKETVYDNLEYEHFKKHGKTGMSDRIREVADLIIETLCSTKDTLNVSGQEYPARLVKEKLLKITSMHIEYVFDCMDKNPSDIRNIKRYLLATLFNAPSTIDSYYTALVNHDLHGTW